VSAVFIDGALLPYVEQCEREHRCDLDGDATTTIHLVTRPSKVAAQLTSAGLTASS